MPRGVYDRTKSKEQRAAEKEPKTAKKGAKAAPQKRKYTRKAVAGQTTSNSSEKFASSFATSSDGAFLLMNEVRSNLTVLSQVKEAFGDLPSVAGEVDAQVSALGQLRAKIFSAAPDEASETVEEEVLEDEAPAVVSNGVASATSVPLPPGAVALPPPALPTH
jgi:hypothetical protein